MASCTSHLLAGAEEEPVARSAELTMIRSCSARAVRSCFISSSTESLETPGTPLRALDITL